MVFEKFLKRNQLKFYIYVFRTFKNKLLRVILAYSYDGFTGFVKIYQQSLI